MKCDIRIIYVCFVFPIRCAPRAIERRMCVRADVCVLVRDSIVRLCFLPAVRCGQCYMRTMSV